MELIEEQTISGGAVTDVTFSGLDGDTDGQYYLSFYVVNAATFTTLTLRPNGLTTGQASRRITAVDGDTISTDATTTLRLGGVLTAAEIWGWGVLQAITGQPRMYTVNSVEADTTPQLEFNGGIWTDTAANITSLVIHADVASAIGNDSNFRLYRIANAFGTA